MKTLQEHAEVLLEYDHEKTMQKHGADIIKRMRFEDPHWTRWSHDGDVSDAHHRVSDSGVLGLYNAWHQEGDPTPHKEYSQWIARHYANGSIRSVEDIPGRTRDALERFHHAKVRKQLARHGINPDINQHKGLGALEDAVAKLPEPEVKDDDKPAPHEYEKHESEHWTHVVPHTEKASCYYGRGTRWCTAANRNNMFNHYRPNSNDQNSQLNILIPKNPRYVGEKYQSHIGTGQFMTDKDEDVGDRRDVFHGRPMPESYSHHLWHYINTPATYSSVSEVIKHGNPEHIDRLIERYGNEMSSQNRAHIGKYGQKKHLDWLMQHPDIQNAVDPEKRQRLMFTNDELAENIARRGYKEHLDVLVRHPSIDVRKQVAWHGDDSHMDVLVHDKEAPVRQQVALTGNDEHRRLLMNDQDHNVRGTAKAMMGAITHNRSHMSDADYDEHDRRARAMRAHARRHNVDESVNQTRTTAQHTDTSMEQGDNAYAYLKKNHPRLHDYLRYEAPVPIDPVMTINAVRSQGEGRTLAMLKQGLKQDALKTYGSDYPVRESVEDDNVVDLGKRRELKSLQQFHGSMMDKVKDGVRKSGERIAELRAAGELPFDVGTRFHTPHSKRNGLPPWKVLGYHVDNKDPEKYGYWAIQGDENGDYTKTVINVNNPNGDKKNAAYYEPGFSTREHAKKFEPVTGPKLVKEGDVVDLDKFVRNRERAAKDQRLADIQQREAGRRKQWEVDRIKELRGRGDLPFEIGDRFHTRLSREDEMPPWEVTGYWAEPAGQFGTAAHGYHAKRVSTPGKAPAEIKIHANYDFEHFPKLKPVK